MLRLALVLLGLTSQATAQDLKYFYTRQECGPSIAMFEEAMQYGETPLFVGKNVVFGVEGTPYYGEMMFTVNQEQGSWSMFTIYPDGTVCMANFGGAFEPVPR